MKTILVDVKFDSKRNAYMHEEICDACDGKYKLIKTGKHLILQGEKGEVVLSLQDLFFAMMNSYTDGYSDHPAVTALKEIEGTTRCGDDCGKTCYCGEDSCIDKLCGIAEKALIEIGEKS